MQCKLFNFWQQNIHFLQYLVFISQKWMWLAKNNNRCRFTGLPLNYSKTFEKLMQRIRLTSDNPVLMYFHITCVYFCRHADREGRRVDLQNTTSSHSRSAKVILNAWVAHSCLLYIFMEDILEYTTWKNFMCNLSAETLWYFMSWLWNWEYF